MTFDTTQGFRRTYYLFQTIPFDMSDVSLAFFVDNAVRDSSETIGERVSMRLHDFLIIFRAETRHLSRYDRFQNELKKAIENEENKKKVPIVV